MRFFADLASVERPATRDLQHGVFFQPALTRTLTRLTRTTTATTATEQ
jgi:hypothetical protein